MPSAFWATMLREPDALKRCWPPNVCCQMRWPPTEYRAASSEVGSLAGVYMSVVPVLSTVHAPLETTGPNGDPGVPAKVSRAARELTIAMDSPSSLKQAFL